MSSIRFGRVLRVVLFPCAAIAFPLSCAFASCSSTRSGATATVTCTAATDHVVISEDLVSFGAWHHTGTAFGADQYDWDSTVAGDQGIYYGDAIIFESLGGGSLTIGDAATPADAVDGTVTVAHTGAASAQITLDSMSSATGNTYTIDDDSSTITVNMLLLKYTDPTGAVLTITTGTAADTVNILTVYHTDTLTVQGNNGADVVNIGNAGSVQGIGGAVTVKNLDDFSLLTIDDSADAIGRTATVTSASVTGIAPAAINWNVNDISGLFLINGSGNDTVNVLATSPAVLNFSLTIQGTSGSDVVHIGNAGSVQEIMAPVMVRNDADYTQLTIDDAADATGREAFYTATGVSGIAPAAISWREADVSQIEVNFGGGDDLVDIFGSPGNALTLISLGNGNNNCFITGAGLHAGSSNFFISGSGDDVYTISAVTANGASIDIGGGPQAVADEIIYTSGPATGTSPGNGTLLPTDPNAHPITYTSIELFNIDDRIFADDF